MKSLSAAGRLFATNSVLSFCDAILYALRSGKLQEAVYFVALEAYYWWCYVFRINSRLIEFNPTPFCRCSEYDVNLADLATTLRLCNFSAIESPTNWCIVTESANGVIFGTTHDRPHVLQRSANLWSPPIDLFEFSKPIQAVFISLSNKLFIATKGVVYLSEDDGKHFTVALQLSDADSFVWHNHGIDETPEGLVIGEYGIIVNVDRTPSFWKSVAYLYSTHDDGKSWRRIDVLAQYLQVSMSTW
jgi:hypothetical protein